MSDRHPTKILNSGDGVDIDDSPLMLGGERTSHPAPFNNRLQLYPKRASDGSLTLYLQDEVGRPLQLSNGGVIDAMWSGATGDGVTNDTGAIQHALNLAASSGRAVYLPEGTYKVTTLLVKNGCRGFYGPGIIQDSGVVGSGVVVLDGPNALGGTAVSECYISLIISMTSGATYGIWADRALNCVFDRCKIYGFTDAADSHALRLNAGSKGNTIRDCKILFSTSTPTHGQGAIVFVADTTAYGGYFSGSGTTTDAVNPCSHNLVIGNYCYKGSHGISGNGLEDTVIVGNTCESQRDRSVILEPVCNRNTVCGNTLHGFGSSAVAIAYGGSYNVVTGNSCKSSPIAGGEAALQAYVGPSFNLFANNVVNTTTNYGVYMGVNVSNNRVIGNHIGGYKQAAIALECDWNSPLPGGATFSRPNFGASPSGQWAYSNSQSNEIKGNMINDGIGGTQCGIYLGQILANGNLNDNEISGNKIQSSALTKYIMVFEETSGRATNNKMSGNTFLLPTAAKFTFTRGRAHFNYWQNNEGLDLGTAAVVTFADGDTTPSVAYGGSFQCSNTSPTSITTFDDAIEAQELIFRFDSNTTLVQNASVMRLKGAVNATTNANGFMRFKLISGIWFELSRNF